MSSVTINLLASAQKMDVTFEPAFLNNSPSQICDQLLYLVKNSNLNFELQETPFSLNLQLKNSFAQHWKRTGYSTRNKPSTQDQFPQPGHNTENLGRQTQDPNLFSSHDPQQYQTHVVPQHQSQHVVPQHHHQPYVPQHLLNVSQCQPHAPQQHHQPHVTQHDSSVHQPLHNVDLQDHQKLSNDQEGFVFLQQIDALKAEHNKAIEENSKDYAELDKAYRKLSKENKELQAKHAKVCSEIKAVKNDTEITVKENNALSVALKSSKKDLEVNSKNSDKEIEDLKAKLAILKKYKDQQEEENRKAKKMEKKMRQKQKKEISRTEDKIVKETKLYNNNVETTDDTEEPITRQKSVTAEEVPTKHSDEIIKEHLECSSNHPSSTKSSTSEPLEAMHVENICDLTAKGFEELLNSIVSDYNLRRKIE